MVVVVLSILAIVLAAFIIAKSCDVFETSTDYLGRNLSDGVKGMTLNAIGSSLPELLTTVFFLINANSDSVGYNLAASIGGDSGSAIFNSIVIPAFVIIAVIRIGINGVSLSKKVILRDGLFLIGAELLFLLVLSGPKIEAWHGWVLTGYYFIYLGYAFITMDRSNQSDQDDDEIEIYEWHQKFLHKKSKGKTKRAWMLLIVSMIIIAAACDILVVACEYLAGGLNINMLFVSLILVAAASSVPDTIISMKDAKKGNHDDSLSNVLGSNIFDITFSCSLPLSLFIMFTGKPIVMGNAADGLLDIRFMLLTVTMLTIALFIFSKKLGKPQLVTLVSLYSIFILYCVGLAYPDTLLGDIVTPISDFLKGTAGVFIKNTAAYIGI